MKKAFSLSEVLLAVGIVAVISTLMITTVIPKGDEKKYSTLANKAYLTLEEAYGVQIMNDAGRDASDYGADDLLPRMTTGSPPALPAYEGEGTNCVQLPNGMIFHYNNGFIYVDLDGVEGKTRSTLNNPSRNCDNADVIRFEIDGSEITPDYDCGSNNYAGEYFEYDDDLY